VRLVEIRLLDGPNVYRLEPTVKIEVIVGRPRTWYGQRSPERHAIVRLGERVPRREAPAIVLDTAAWVSRLHQLTGADGWLQPETSAEAGTTNGARRTRRRPLPVDIHRSSDPGHWIVAYPWRERERAEAIAEAAYRLADRNADPSRTKPAARTRAGRALARSVEAVREAGMTPPSWITDDRRLVPCISISGTNGKSTTTRMLTHIFAVAGRHVGTTTSDGVLIDEELVEAGDLTGPQGARTVLEHPGLAVAVLETARGGIVLRGVGYESNDASILTNVSSDHLDLMGLHTLPELAEVKSVVSRITKPDGVVVLNADDALVAPVARRVRAPVCLFSLRPRSKVVTRHLARGGQAMLLEDGWLVEVTRGVRKRILRATDAPATLLGLARHNVANALAAAAGARAMGATIEEVSAGLRDYRATAELAPGRLNLYRQDGQVVIVDFAHNEAGLGVVLDVAEGITGPRRTRRVPLIVIAGTAGDRPDDTLRGIGRIAAERADQLFIKETLRYLRGRTRESVEGELRAGMRAGGARNSAITTFPDEITALAGALDAQRGAAGVIVVMCHESRDEAAALLIERGFAATDAEGLRDLLAE
jgi:cyanophycin synthetase